MRFLETSVCTKELRTLLADDEYRTLQTVLMLRPEQGPLIRGTGGLRKIRWGGKGKGKRGGFRVIYYWHRETETFYMLFIYQKSEQEELTSSQRKLLASLVRKEFK